MAGGTSSRKVYTINDLQKAIEARSEYSSSNKYSSSDKKNEDLLAILPFLFMMSGSQHVQCSMVVMMIAAAMGVLATQRLLTSPLHK